MAEKIVSPGVFTRENDLSFVQSGVGAIGGAIIGPTVKGPAMIPTKVFSYSEFQTLFGDSFKSGSDYYQYLTSHAAKDYLKHGGPLTVVRILGGEAYSNAEARTHFPGQQTAGTAPTVAVAFVAADILDGSTLSYTSSVAGQEIEFHFVDAPLPANTPGIRYVESSSAGSNLVNLGTTLGNFTTSFNAAGLGDSAVQDGNDGVNFTGTTNITNTGLQLFINGIGTPEASTNGTAFTASFDTSNVGIPNSSSTAALFTQSLNIKTIADGIDMNSVPTGVGPNDILIHNNIKFGTKDNLRWEVTNVNEAKGTFTLLVRRGDDTKKRKVILETHSNCSLDPQATNYVGKRIGTQYHNYDFNNNIVKSNGTYPNMSKYIYVDEVSIAKTVDYLDDNGNITDTDLTGSLPQISSGSFAGGSDGAVQHPKNFYENITTTNVQGLNLGPNQSGAAAYTNAINLLRNQDEYDINLIMAPGVNASQHPAIVTNLITMCEERGDCMAIVDPVGYGSTVALASAQSAAKDSSYAAMYWPWVQIADNVTGKFVWVPQSTVMPGIYAFNDKVSAEWFAPAGLNRGGQETVIQAEQKLTHANRDTMYEENLNPVATFPGEGVVVWGQKTLQKKASALDRVNVRRLLINLKKFIASTSKYLVFEQNTDTTRNRFLATVNPYMESVQQRQGLYAFKVVMDSTNNTPDVIDRNILKGDIFLQPAKAAEFIVIDFNVMPTGATFND